MRDKIQTDVARDAVGVRQGGRACGLGYAGHRSRAVLGAGLVVHRFTLTMILSIS